MKVTVIQLNSQEDVDRNLLVAERLMVEASRLFKTRLFVLPEFSHFVGGTPEQKFASAEIIPQGKACRFFSDMARKLDAAIHCGTLNEVGGERMYNTTVVFAPSGEELCRYRKLYLMDARLPNGREIRESKFYAPGHRLVSFALDGIRFGCTTCYDVRFPEMYRALTRSGVTAFIFVAAMPYDHGAPHLEVLLRARAIENQAFVIAADQCGTFQQNTRRSYGNSMIIDPWGTVEARLGDEIGYINYELDLGRALAFRNRMPILAVADEVAMRTGGHQDALHASEQPSLAAAS